MGEDLPSTFDLVVVGTGVAESILSAAASRNGHSVLHLDPRDYYGSQWATLNFDAWEAEEFVRPPPGLGTVGGENGEIRLGWRNLCEGVEQRWYVEAEREGILRERRRFNIDLLPQVILAREELIELLIQSDVSRYLEFLRVGKLFTQLEGQGEIVSIPLSRSDIFTSKSVGLAEKRGLAKFIEQVLKDGKEREEGDVDGDVEEQRRASPGRSFEELASACKLTPKLRHLVKSVVERVDDFLHEEKEEALFGEEFTPRCQLYLKSIGRFGNQTPFLWPMYGVSEICQGFCRLSAVYGGIFILKRFINSVKRKQDGVLEIRSENDTFTTKNLVIGSELVYLKGNGPLRTSSKKRIGRGVIIVKGGNLKLESDGGSAGDGIGFYRIGKLFLVELSHLSHAVPKGYRLLQITLPVDENVFPTETLREIIEGSLQELINFSFTADVGSNETEEVETILADGDSSENDSEEPPPKSEIPYAVYGTYFWLSLHKEENLCSGDILSCSEDSAELTPYIRRATDIFNSIFPGEEFLPKPPLPEEPVEEEDEEHEEGERDLPEDNKNIEISTSNQRYLSEQGNKSEEVTTFERDEVCNPSSSS